jgi:hypothetical protein
MKPLVEPAVVAEEEPLVAGVDHHGVVGEAACVEVVEDPADVLVECRDTAQIVL